MTEATKTENSKTAKSEAGDERTYIVLEEITADGDEMPSYQMVRAVIAKDEKSARWAAVDADKALAAAVADPTQEITLVAISERNWTPKATREEVVTTKRRA